jgi:hypothetical protein
MKNLLREDADGELRLARWLIFLTGFSAIACGAEVRNVNVDEISSEAQSWLTVGGNPIERHGFESVWIEQNKFWAIFNRKEYTVGAVVYGGGIVEPGDPKRVRYQSIKELCAHLRTKGYKVSPSRKIRIMNGVCGNDL